MAEIETPEERSAMQGGYFTWFTSFVRSLKVPTVQDAWMAAWLAGRDWARNQQPEAQRQRDGGEG